MYHKCEWPLYVLLRILLALHWVVDCVNIMRIRPACDTGILVAQAENHGYTSV
jgi:hypothetical protein